MSNQKCQIDLIPLFICILSIVNIGLLIAELAYSSHWYQHIYPWWGYSTHYITSKIEKYLIVVITFCCLSIVGTLIFPRFFASSANARTRIKIAGLGFTYICSGVMICVFGFMICQKTNTHEKCNEIKEHLLMDGYNEVDRWTMRRYTNYVKKVHSQVNFFNNFCFKRSKKFGRILVSFGAILFVMMLLLICVFIVYSGINEEFVQP